MPFFWFGGGSSSSSTATVGGQSKSSVAISSQRNHTRKLSQSLSASSGKNAARLAEVRSEATASYLQHQSEHQQNHRRTQSDISRSHRSRTSTGSGHGKRGGVIAIEDDDDSRHKCRIDQGLIDACNEAKVPETKASWWTSFSVTAITPPSSPSLLPEYANETASKPAPNINGTPLKHRRTISKTTYRV